MKISKENLKTTLIALASSLLVSTGVVTGDNYLIDQEPTPKEQITDAEAKLIQQGYEYFYTDLIVQDTLPIVLNDGPFPERSGYVIDKDLIKGQLIWKKQGEIVSVPWLNENVDLPAPFENAKIIGFGKLYKK